MSETNSVATAEAPVATPKAPKAAPKPRPEVKKAVAKATRPAKGESKAPASKAPKSKPMPDGESVHANEPIREPKWSSRRVAIVKAMRNLRAVTESTAKSAAEIAVVAAKMGAAELGDMTDYGNRGAKGVYLVKCVLDVYRTAELVHNGFVASTKHEGDRELRYYLTDKGRKTTFPSGD